MFSFKNNETEIDDAVGDDTIFATVRIRPLIAANCTDFVLAHSNVALRPIRQVSEIFMMPHILDVMNKLGLNKLLRVQSHTWRHLIVDRSHGAMIVAAPRSGRTLSYILPVCDVVSRSIMDMNDEKRGDRPSGPLSVILVPDLERVRRVNALCYAFLRNVKHSWTYTLTLTVPSIIKPEFFHRLFNGVGCLVATPAQLVWVLSQGQLSIKHLKVIVYDDLDLMDPEKLKPAVEGLNKLMRTDTDDDEPQHPQLVMVSQRYEPHYMATLKLLNRNPALIFGDMLEAAMYGDMRLQIALRTAQDKLNDVLKLLQQRPPHDYRTVIFCSDDADMRRLVGLLEQHLYSCLPYYQDADLGVGEQVHRWIGDTRGIILLATDNCPELSIRHAHTLIHYSMSSSWGKFKMRHLAVSGNLINKLDRNSSSSSCSSSKQLHSLVLLDDTNQTQLPRLVDFVAKFQPVDDTIVAVAKQIRKQLAADLEPNQNVVCRQIMMMGDCINSVCEERHHVDHQADCPTALVPASGDVKVLLVRVYSPTHFCVHLLEHLPPSAGQSWKTFPSLPAEQMRLQLMQGDSNERYWPPVAGDVCLYRTNENKMRVRVLKVEPIKNVNLSVSNLDVLVQAMDEDTQVFKVKSGRLYECPEELQAKPPLAIDLRLFGVVPRSGERDWSEEDRRAVQQKVQGLPEKCFLQASIQFATAHTIFIRNLMVISYASSMKMYVRRLGLYQHLTETTGLAKSCEQAKDKILAFFEDAIPTTGLEPVLTGQLKEMPVEEQQQQLKEVTKENDPPNKPVLKGKAFDDVIQMGLERFPFGGNAKKQQQLQREEAKEAAQAAEQLKHQNNNNNSLKLLVECINNVANLTVDDGKEMPDEERNEMFMGASKLLDHMEHGSETTSQGVLQPKKSRKKKTNTKQHAADDFKVTPPRNPDMHLVLPPNVVRPPTTYYQTATTLELHVLLPDDSFEYSALLTGNQVLFIGHHPSTELRHQFTLTLGVPYSSMRDYMRGRTVYMSVKKTVAMPDPLNYVQYYHFLKPNHDKFGQMDEDPKEQAQKFANYDQRLAFVAYEEEEDGCNTEDEDGWMDGCVERVNKYDKYED